MIQDGTLESRINELENAIAEVDPIGDADKYDRLNSILKGLYEQQNAKVVAEAEADSKYRLIQLDQDKVDDARRYHDAQLKAQKFVNGMTIGFNALNVIGTYTLPLVDNSLQKQGEYLDEKKYPFYKGLLRIIPFFRKDLGD